MYGIEPQLFVTSEPEPIPRPDWFPQGESLDEWAALVAHPREHAEVLAERGLSSLPPEAVAALRDSRMTQQTSY
jgi:hypothetical protein